MSEEGHYVSAHDLSGEAHDFVYLLSRLIEDAVLRALTVYDTERLNGRLPTQAIEQAQKQEQEG